VPSTNQLHNDNGTRHGLLHKNSGAHVMLLVLKFYNRPVTFHEIREIASDKKINANNQRRHMDTLMRGGYAVAVEESPGGVEKFQITHLGIGKVYDMVSDVRYKR